MTVSAKQLMRLFSKACTNDADAVAVNKAVRLSGADKVAPASASTADHVFGVVSEVIDSTHCRVVTMGPLADFSTGMTAGTPYFLGEAGAMSTSPGANLRLVAFAVNATDLFVRIEKPQVVALGSCHLTSAGALTLTTGGTWYGWSTSSSAVWEAVDTELFTHSSGILTYVGTEACWMQCAGHIYAGSTAASGYYVGISKNGASPDLVNTVRLAGTATTCAVQRSIYMSTDDTIELTYSRPSDLGQVQTFATSWLTATALSLT